MIHQPHHSMSGMTSDILIKATKAEETRNALTMSLVETTGRTFEEVEKALDRNTYLFAESARQFGIVDRVCVNWKDLTTEEEKEATTVKKNGEEEKEKSVATSSRVSGGRGIGQQQEQQKKVDETKKTDATTTETKKK
jgi:membrane-bound ClpP family serine protease